MTQLDVCITCGSRNIKTVEKVFSFDLPNPGTIKVQAECEECVECGEDYFNDSQMTRISRKVDEEKGKLLLR